FAQIPKDAKKISENNQKDFLSTSGQENMTKMLKLCSNKNSELLLAKYTALYELRNAVFHVQKVKTSTPNKKNKFSQPSLDVIYKKLKNDVQGAREAFIEKLKSNDVLKYYSKEDIRLILNQPLNLQPNPAAFAPAFKNVIKRGRGLKESASKGQKETNWAPDKIKLGTPETAAAPTNAAHYLLQLIYYHYFLPEFIQNKCLFTKAIKTVENNNKTTKGYKQFFSLQNDLLKSDDNDFGGNYLAAIQSLEADRLKIQEKRADQIQKNKEQPYFQRYIRDIFAAGFNCFIHNKKDLILNQTSEPINTYYEGSDGLSAAIEDFRGIINVNDDGLLNHGSNSHEADKQKRDLCRWYALLLLLSPARLNSLKGDLAKYNQARKQFKLDKIFDIDSETLTKLINLRMLYNLAAPEEIPFSLLSIFVDFECDPLDDQISCNNLRLFEPKNSGPGQRTQMYLSGDKVIAKKALVNLRQYNTEAVFKALNLKKIAACDCEEFYKQEQKIANTVNDREKKHQAWVKYKDKFTNRAEYETLINKEQEYMWLKNKVDLVHLERLNNLLQDIWSSWVSTAYLWERDLYYLALSILKALPRLEGHENMLEDKEVIEQLHKDMGKVGFIEKLPSKAKGLLFSILGIDEKKYGELKRIRNSIAHGDYFKKTEKSLLTYLAQMRKLMAYDRKLKNSVTKSFIEILNKHGLEIKFKPLHNANHELEIEIIEPKKITHLRGMKINDGQLIQSNQVHKEYAEMVEKLLIFSHEAQPQN
ncbi:MAG: type VI-A CRISPR-associated RNA-guided ribonuclease Cas13a, partial [Candidatus Adiutrix sp.]